MKPKALRNPSDTVVVTYGDLMDLVTLSQRDDRVMIVEAIYRRPSVSRSGRVLRGLVSDLEERALELSELLVGRRGPRAGTETWHTVDRQLRRLRKQKERLEELMERDR